MHLTEQEGAFGSLYDGKGRADDVSSEVLLEGVVRGMVIIDGDGKVNHSVLGE